MTITLETLDKSIRLLTNLLDTLPSPPNSDLSSDSESPFSSQLLSLSDPQTLSEESLLHLDYDSLDRTLDLNRPTLEPFIPLVQSVAKGKQQVERESVDYTILNQLVNEFREVILQKQRESSRESDQQPLFRDPSSRSPSPTSSSTAPSHLPPPPFSSSNLVPNSTSINRPTPSSSDPPPPTRFTFTSLMEIESTNPRTAMTSSNSSQGTQPLQQPTTTLSQIGASGGFSESLPRANQEEEEEEGMLSEKESLKKGRELDDSFDALGGIEMDFEQEEEGQVDDKEIPQTSRGKNRRNKSGSESRFREMAKEELIEHCEDLEYRLEETKKELQVEKDRRKGKGKGEGKGKGVGQSRSFDEELDSASSDREASEDEGEMKDARKGKGKSEESQKNKKRARDESESEEGRSEDDAKKPRKDKNKERLKRKKQRTEEKSSSKKKGSQHSADKGKGEESSSSNSDDFVGEPGKRPARAKERSRKQRKVEEEEEDSDSEEEERSSRAKPIRKKTSTGSKEGSKQKSASKKRERSKEKKHTVTRDYSSDEEENEGAKPRRKASGRPKKSSASSSKASASSSRRKPMQEKDSNARRSSRRTRETSEEEEESSDDQKGFEEGTIVFAGEFGIQGQAYPAVLLRVTPKYNNLWYAKLPGSEKEPVEIAADNFNKPKDVSLVQSSRDSVGILTTKIRKKLEYAIEFSKDAKKVKGWFELACTSLPDLKEDKENYKIQIGAVKGKGKAKTQGKAKGEGSGKGNGKKGKLATKREKSSSEEEQESDGSGSTEDEELD